jgi:hypothetical protein
MQNKALDEKFAKKINNECHTTDKKIDHSSADHYLCELLKELGYTSTVEAWEKVKKWYA